MRPLRLISAALALVLAPLFVAGPAQAYETGYYSVPYSDTLLLHQHGSAGQSTTVAASSERWRQDGFPRPTPAPTDYVQTPWSSRVNAVHFFGEDAGEWAWSGLSYTEWTRAGRPAPRPVAHTPFATYTKYETSDEIFTSEWGSEIHKMTPAEWRAAGSPRPSVNPAGYYRYSWHPNIAVLDSDRRLGGQVTAEAWAIFGSPTPAVVTSLPGDVVWKTASSPQLWLDSAIVWGHPLTFAEWSALGRLTPQIR